MVHAATSYVIGRPEEAGAWFAASNNLVLLEVEDERALEALLARLIAAGVGAVTFREPDLDDALTAVAAGAEARKLVSSIPLALKSKPKP